MATTTIASRIVRIDRVGFQRRALVDTGHVIVCGDRGIMTYEGFRKVAERQGVTFRSDVMEKAAPPNRAEIWRDLLLYAIAAGRPVAGTKRPKTDE